MKRADDPRHLKRISIMQSLFSESFFEQPEGKLTEHILVIKKLLPEIDQKIEESAPQFPISKISKVDAAVLRLSVYELLYERKEPIKVIVDEAVELAKEFGGDNSPSFINGVLGNIIKKYGEIQKSA